jgi:thymidine kinase
MKAFKEFEPINLSLIRNLIRVSMSLELILGPMFAGKTSALQSIIRRHEALGIRCAVFKPQSDTRYGSDSFMYSHDQTKVSAVPTKTLSSQLDFQPYIGSSLIVIEEGQFFDDLYDFIIIAVEYDKKHVVVGGLDGDCFRKPFGQILQLIPIADRVTKLTSLCKICADGTIGLFSYRNSDSKETVEVGGSEKYMPLCRKHYLTCSGQQVRTVGLPTIRVTLECHPKVCLP